MGADNSTGHIKLSCDSVTINSGEDITGHIYIQLPKTIRDKCALYIVFVGSQVVEWNSGLFSTTKGKHYFRKEQKKIMTWKDALKKGQYDIPFMLQLPSDLITSFKLAEEKYRASVAYKIHCVLVSKLFKKKDTNKIEIMNAGDIERVPFRTYEKLIVKRSCFKANVIEISGQTDYNIYYSDENIDFEVIYDNSKCNFDIRDIVVSLVRRITLKTPKGEVTQASRVFYENKFASISSGQSKKSVFAGRFSLAPIHEALAVSKSLKTDFIICKYFLLISHKAVGCCSSLLKNVELEVVILPRKPSLMPQAIESPEDWNPQQLPMARLSYKDFKPSAPVLEEDNI